MSARPVPGLFSCMEFQLLEVDYVLRVAYDSLIVLNRLSLSRRSVDDRLLNQYYLLNFVLWRIIDHVKEERNCYTMCVCVCVRAWVFEVTKISDRNMNILLLAVANNRNNL